MQLKLTILVVSERHHELVEQLHAHRTRQAMVRAFKCETYLGVLLSFKPRLMRCFRETKPGKARRNHVETGLIVSASCQERQELLHFKEVPGP